MLGGAFEEQSMLFRNLLLGASVATALGFAAQAQTMPAPDEGAAPPSAEQAPAPAGADTGTDASTTAAKPGMVVKDSAGETVGQVVQVGQTADGQAAVVVNVDGRPFTLAANMLTPAGDGMVSSVTKAQIKAAAAKSPG
jgi:hypothetical protein